MANRKISSFKEHQKNETVSVLETVLFTNIIEKQIGKMKVTELLPVIDWMANEEKLDLYVVKSGNRIAIGCKLDAFRKVRTAITKAVTQN